MSIIVSDQSVVEVATSYQHLPLLWVRARVQLRERLNHVLLKGWRKWKGPNWRWSVGRFYGSQACANVNLPQPFG